MSAPARPAVAYLRPPDRTDLGLGSPPGLEIVDVVAELDTGPRTRVHEALERIASGEAEAVFVLRLNAIAGSPRELVALLDWLQDAGADLVAADVALDTGTVAGRGAVALAREIERWSREPDRPRGRPGLSAAAPGLAERIAMLRRQGLSLHAIAAQLEAEGVPTPRGGSRWRASSVQSALGYRRPPPPPAPGAPPPRPAAKPRPPGTGTPPRPGPPLPPGAKRRPRP